MFGAETIDDNYRKVLLEGKPRPEIFTVPKIMPGAAAGQVSMNLGLRGPTFGVTSACSSSNHAFASAIDQLVLGRADVMIAGGAEAPMSWGVLKSWEALRIMAADTCRPFSADRQGVVMGEGAGMAVLETYEHAKARGATILAELAGVGISADAVRHRRADRRGTGGGDARLPRRCRPQPGGRRLPQRAWHRHQGQRPDRDRRRSSRCSATHAAKLSVSSTKSMHAHCLGASGALEMIACVMAIREGVIPPTANYREPDPDCDLDVTPNVARERKVRAAISNGFAFGGTNAVVAFKAA